MVPRAAAGTGVIRLAWPDLGPEELSAVAEVFESGQLTMGPRVEEFEQELARACEVEHALVVSSGTAALHLSVLALGIGPGDEVIVPAYTFPATANVVALAGAKPVLVDVDAETMNVTAESVASAVTERTKAVLVVHLFGRPAPWEELEEAVPEGVALLEDAAGALGARRQGRACGGLGRLGCLSFHPRKIVTTGEGGAVTTNDAELAERVRSLRHHGWSPSDAYDDMPSGAFNYRLSDILCAVGIPQMRRLEQLLADRERVAAGYAERLRDLPVLLPSADEGDRHGWQAYVIQLDRRDEAMAALRAQGIQCQIGTYALHRLSAYGDQGSFPGADACFERALALPFHTALTDAELDRVAEALTTVVSE
ncbi:MAG TPA: DegT/DnrJ/EryC1/StrS family aminotransferase [Gaiellaceae bacterium]|nr:DegT/DnrJ/EryC1/StrS family aminotransferase [Gaiellaceae bacterium]